LGSCLDSIQIRNHSGNNDRHHHNHQTLSLPQPRPRPNLDRRHQAQGPAQTDSAAGGAGHGASGRHHLALHRRHRRSGGTERTFQPLLAADHPAGPDQQHRLPLLPSRPGTVLGTGATTGHDHHPGDHQQYLVRHLPAQVRPGCQAGRGAVPGHAERGGAGGTAGSAATVLFLGRCRGTTQGAVDHQPRGF